MIDMNDTPDKKVTLVTAYENLSRGLAEALRTELGVEVEKVVGDCRNELEGIVVVDVIINNDLWEPGLDLVEKLNGDVVVVSSHIREHVEGAIRGKTPSIVEKPDYGWGQTIELVRGKLI